MKILSRYRFLWILLLLPVALAGQELGHGSVDQQVFQFRVKHLDDFADRFNGDTGHTGGYSSALTRQALLATLFDLDDPRFLRDAPSHSADYEAVVSEFIEEVCRDTLYLDSNSENIYASAHAVGFLNGQQVEFSVILRQERVGADMLKWVIRDVEAGFLDFPVKDDDTLRFLPPSSGELDFIELRRALKDVAHLQEYAGRDYTYDPLSVFFYLLHSGDLTDISIREANYLVYDIPGWCMVLRDFSRLTKNSGWLITDLYRIE